MKINLKKKIKYILPKILQQTIKQILSNREIQQWIKNGRPVPPPHKIKQMTIDKYQKENLIHVFVETGTYLGAMVDAQLNNFQNIYSIELSEELYQRALKRFKKQPKVKLIQGDSGKVLQTLILQINERAIFWLDGHYSAGITAKGDVECPIYEELKAIFKSPLNHILLIDDARCFSGQGDYPSIQDLSEYIISQRSTAHIKVEDDIIRVMY
ncbi:MAG: hypothetical protein LBE04_04380 [Prevotellaceae bacterium]|jgi:hypothetical protein|nr:hypothetical protein [Prevotellaceae bacterium]